MADNVAITAGTGTTVAADDIGGVYYQRVKITWGADGTANDTNATTPLPIAGPSAHDAATAGAPVLEGGYASAAAPTDVSADGDTVRGWRLRNGAAAVNVTAAGALIPGDATNGLDVDVTRIGGVAPAFGSGANGATVLRVALATDSPGITTTVAHDAADSGDPLKIGGYAKAAAPTVVSADGDRVNAWYSLRGEAFMTIAVGGAIIGGDATNGLDVDVTRVTGGGVAHDGADSGNPIKVGGRARSTEIAAVASDDRADFVTDLVGKQIVLPYANPENFVSGATAAMTGTTSTSLIAAPGAGLRNYITQVTVSNSHATVGTDVHLQDGSGGTVLYVIPAAAVYGGATITFPTPLRQPTANTALFVVNATTGASTRVSASGYKGA